MKNAEGILSLDTKFYYNSGSAEEQTWVQVLDLQEVPELGGTPEKVEVTTLQNAARRYIKGLKEYGDLSFVFLYDNAAETSNYRVLRKLEDDGLVHQFKVELPDGATFVFSGEPSTKLNSIGINAALTFNLDIALNSDIVVTNPIGA